MNRQEAINIVKKNWPDSSFTSLKEALEFLIPELMNTDDEKIKEAIIKGIIHAAEEGCFCADNYSVKECVAWIEKQCKNNMSISEATKQKLEDNLYKALEKETPESWNEFLQEGEQKPTIEMKTPEESLGIDSSTYNKIVDECIYGERKPADKVEPKFHQGEWIVHHGTENIYQVVAIIDNQYQLKYGDNYTTQYCEDVDRCTRLYDVTKDAKDGDVLASGQLIIIFKEFEEETDWNFVIAYAGVDNCGKLQVTNEHWLINNNTKPASKEQCDTLEKAMADAGYTFDFKKKELKKIEQKPITDFSDLRTWKYIVDAVLTEKEGIGQYLDSPLTKEIAKKLQKRFGNIEQILANSAKTCKDEQNPIWSEEDEMMLECVLDKIGDLGSGGMCKDWLKSLKERVQPQPRQEWSEEDENTLNSIINYLEEVSGRIALPNLKENYIRQIDWLQSLRPQPHWKPSDEQIKALANALSLAKNCGEECSFDLRTLHEQLKKLREE